DLDNAESSFRAAQSIACEQGTKGFELRAATSLARLFGQRRAARAGARIVGARLRLVHRGVRHRRSEGCESAARRAGVGVSARDRVSMNPGFDRWPRERPEATRKRRGVATDFSVSVQSSWVAQLG